MPALLAGCVVTASLAIGAFLFAAGCAVLAGFLLDERGQRRAANARIAELDEALTRESQANGGLVDELVKVTDAWERAKYALRRAQWHEEREAFERPLPRRQPDINTPPDDTWVDDFLRHTFPRES